MKYFILSLTFMMLSCSTPTGNKAPMKNVSDYIKVTSPLPFAKVSKTLIIKGQAKVAQKYNKRREALKKRMGRIFYIYSQLMDKDEFDSKDVLDRCEVSKRTFYRDMEIIKEVCIDLNIENIGDGKYSIRDRY